MTLSDNARQAACLGAAGFLGTMLVVAVTASSPAHAKTPIEVVAGRTALTTRVPFADLSLKTSEGRNMLYRRVAYGVEVVCPPKDEMGFEYFVQDCKDFAWKGARPQIYNAIRAARFGTSSLAMAIELTAAHK